MIKIAPELIETVTVGQVLFKIAEVVLAELCCCIATRLQDLRNRYILLLQTGRRPACRPSSGRCGLEAGL